jgi:hypothetical protein
MPHGIKPTESKGESTALRVCKASDGEEIAAHAHDSSAGTGLARSSGARK